ncbi:MAG TPA: cytochrome c oxidase subunit 3 [Rhodanobacteraceae bacterium]|nr:cytochrome c oxidase subunit 3 [Rhodanobacteraceae bacterium]
MSAVVVESAVVEPVPIGGVGRRSMGWWGLVALIATEGALFAYLLFAYYYLLVQLGPSWFPEREPTLKLALPDTNILLVSSATVWWAERSIRRGARGAALAGLALTFVLGLVFLIVQLFEWKAKPYTMQTNSYGSLYYTITGFHMAHVTAGLIALLLVFVWCLAGYLDDRRHVPLLIGAAYWHFVDVVWLTVFFTFYLMPRFW